MVSVRVLQPGRLGSQYELGEVLEVTPLRAARWARAGFVVEESKAAAPSPPEKKAPKKAAPKKRKTARRKAAR